MAYYKRGLISYLLIALILFHAEAAFGWGNEGHVYINRVAAQKIPADIPRFLRRAVAENTYLGPEPDASRKPAEFALKNAQEPAHLIDVTRLTSLAPLAHR